jgi:hypothetical protein
MLRALAEVPDLLVDPLPPLDEVLQLGDERWARDWPVESVEGLRPGHRVVLEDVPGALVSALRRDAHRLGVTTGELTVLLLSAATYRTAMPCRHDARAAWLSDPSDPALGLADRSDPTRVLTDPSDPGRVLPDRSDGGDDCDDDLSDLWPEELAALASEAASPSG